MTSLRQRANAFAALSKTQPTMSLEEVIDHTPSSESRAVLVCRQMDEPPDCRSC